MSKFQFMFGLALAGVVHATVSAQVTTQSYAEVTALPGSLNGEEMVPVTTYEKQPDGSVLPVTRAVKVSELRLAAPAMPGMPVLTPRAILREKESGKIVAKLLSDVQPSDNESIAKLMTDVERARIAIHFDKSTEAEKADAKKLLDEYIDVLFELDMLTRQDQLKSLEEQFDKLREQLKKRAEGKAKFIKARLEQAELVGTLSFFSEPTPVQNFHPGFRPPSSPSGAILGGGFLMPSVPGQPVLPGTFPPRIDQ
jgi:hypothetical protein